MRSARQETAADFRANCSGPSGRALPGAAVRDFEFDGRRRFASDDIRPAAGCLVWPLGDAEICLL